MIPPSSNNLINWVLRCKILASAPYSFESLN